MREAADRAGVIVAADCADLDELIAATWRERPDACLLDRDLLGGGLAAAAAIAAPRCAPRVLLVGGRGSPAERRAARLAGAADCLPGRADATELAAAITALARRATPSR
jgi:two-component system, NarL family, response regulator DesR